MKAIFVVVLILAAYFMTGIVYENYVAWVGGCGAAMACTNTSITNPINQNDPFFALMTGNLNGLWTGLSAIYVGNTQIAIPLGSGTSISLPSSITWPTLGSTVLGSISYPSGITWPSLGTTTYNVCFLGSCIGIPIPTLSGGGITWGSYTLYFPTLTGGGITMTSVTVIPSQITLPFNVASVLSTLFGGLMVVLALTALANSEGARLLLNFGFGMLIWPFINGLLGGWTNLLPYGASTIVPLVMEMIFIVGLVLAGLGD
jgi:hypothetical protein